MHTHSLWWSGYSQRIHRPGLRDPQTSPCACPCALSHAAWLLRNTILHIACTYFTFVLYVPVCRPVYTDSFRLYYDIDSTIVCIE